MGIPVKVAMPNGQVGLRDSDDIVLADLGSAVDMMQMPADGTYGVPLAMGGANGVRRFVLVSADVFNAKVIALVSAARQDLVTQSQQTDAALQAQLDKINAIVVPKVVKAALSVPYTATVALLAPTTKQVAVIVPGIVKDELVEVTTKTLPAGWGFGGVAATAADTLTFTLSVPALSINGSGTCVFDVWAMRKLGG